MDEQAKYRGHGKRSEWVLKKVEGTSQLPVHGQSHQVNLVARTSPCRSRLGRGDNDRKYAEQYYLQAKIARKARSIAQFRQNLLELCWWVGWGGLRSENDLCSVTFWAEYVLGEAKKDI